MPETSRCARPATIAPDRHGGLSQARWNACWQADTFGPAATRSTVHSESRSGFDMLRVLFRVRNQPVCNPEPVCPVRGGRALQPGAASLTLVTGPTPP